MGGTTLTILKGTKECKRYPQFLLEGYIPVQGEKYQVAMPVWNSLMEEAAFATSKWGLVDKRALQGEAEGRGTSKA